MFANIYQGTTKILPLFPSIDFAAVVVAVVVSVLKKSKYFCPLTVYKPIHHNKHSLEKIYSKTKFICYNQSRSFHLSHMDLIQKQNNANRELRERAHRICCEHLGGAWKQISPDQMSFTPVTGGMSNLLYCCSLPDSIKLPSDAGEPTQALLRLYGDQSRNCDMTLQVEIFELLSMRELGPKLYGVFQEGRLEEFLPANSLTNDELMDGEISSIIARKLAQVHCLDVPNMNKECNWLLERFHEWSQFVGNQQKSTSPLNYTDALLPASTLRAANRLLSIDFEQEIRFVRQMIDSIRSPVVFSHNDLHQGNILLAKPTKRRTILEQRVILIDFEYCSYNYRAYDIANHFCEWCFDYDTPDYPHFAMFEERFPSLEVQREFIRNYLDQQASLSLRKTSSSLNGAMNGHGKHMNNNGNHHEIKPKTRYSGNGVLHDNNNRHENGNSICYSGVTFRNCLESKGQAMNVSDQEVDKILREIKPFCIAANLVWTLWCIKSAYASNIKFGFWDHAWVRWQLYLTMKQSYLTSRTQRGRLVDNVKSNIPPIMTQSVDIEARR